MSTQLALIAAPVLVGLPPVDGSIQGQIVRAGLRDSTIKRYLGPAHAWEIYCAERGEPVWDASTSTLIRWLDSRIRHASAPGSVIKTSLAAARWVQKAHCAIRGVDAVPYTPRARVQLDAFSRTATMDKGPPKRARALRLESLLALVQHVRHDARARAGLTAREAQVLAARDVSMLLIGWWGALRADDLARLEWQHIEFHPEGLALHIPTSKTTWAVLALTRRPDSLALCPMLNLASVRVAEVASGAGAPAHRSAFGRRRDERVFGFDSAGSCARRITTLFRRAGVPRGYTSHSLRAGFATEAAAQGVADMLVQRHGRWLSASQHAEYVRDGRLWLDTPTSRISTPQVALPSRVQ